MQNVKVGRFISFLVGFIFVEGLWFAGKSIMDMPLLLLACQCRQLSFITMCPMVFWYLNLLIYITYIFSVFACELS